jgi:hypothetical protein
VVRSQVWTGETLPNFRKSLGTKYQGDLQSFSPAELVFPEIAIIDFREKTRSNQNRG